MEHLAAPTHKTRESGRHPSIAGAAGSLHRLYDASPEPIGRVSILDATCTVVDDLREKFQRGGTIVIALDGTFTFLPGPLEGNGKDANEVDAMQPACPGASDMPGRSGRRTRA